MSEQSESHADGLGGKRTREDIRGDLERLGALEISGTVELTHGMYRALCGLVHPTEAIDPTDIVATTDDWERLRQLFPLADASTVEEGHVPELYHTGKHEIEAEQESLGEVNMREAAIAVIGEDRVPLEELERIVSTYALEDTDA